MAKKNAIPIYLQVAVDVAGRVVRDELKVGQKISGRTTLASEYNVSPETIRKAMKLLSDVNIVTVKHGNGIHVSSVEHAEDFMERYRIKTNVNQLKEELLDLMRQRDAIEEKMNDTMNSIIDYTSRFKNSDHITVNEYFINYPDRGIEKKICDLELKKHTGATIVGINRGGSTILSPDAKEIIKAQDKIFYVGIPASSIRLGEYLRDIYGD